MKFPDQYRAKHPFGFEHKPGDPFGWFMIPSPIKENQWIAVMADGQTEWEHVSASLRNRTPTWDEMCHLKNLFWEENEMVVQFHPEKEDYINNAKNCLHIWKYKGFMPKPPTCYVGIK